MQSSNSMLVYLGANTHTKLVHQLLGLKSDIRFITSNIFPESPASLNDDEKYNDAVIVFDAAIPVESGEINFTTINNYNLLPIINKIMDDKQLPLLWSRFRNEIRRRNESEVKRYEVVYSLIKSSIETCFTHKPSSIVFSYEPHMLPIYIFKQVASALNIKVHTLTISPFVWRLYCESEGGDDLYRKEHLIQRDEEINIESVKKMIGEKQGLYREAKPFYEKRKVSKNMFVDFTNKLKVNGWNPKRALLSQYSAAEYQGVISSRKDFRGLKYVSLFLQYQPEQTTLPDGGLFVNQMFAIQTLYSAVSSLGLSLVVREHPATFKSTFDPKWRPRGYFKAIKNIGENIYFDSIDEDPFTLIEDSIAVSSINGTVLLEGLLRGKPAISFGKHTMKGLDIDALVDTFTDEDELRVGVEKSIETPSAVIVDSVEKYLYNVYSSTFGAKVYKGNETMSLAFLRELRCDALLQVVNLLLENATTNE